MFDVIASEGECLHVQIKMFLDVKMYFIPLLFFTL